MFLEHQNQFRDNEMGHPLEAGYSELYAEWKEQNKNVLYQWSPEERTQRFADFVREHVDEQIQGLIAKKPEVEKKHLEAEAKRGSLLLVSTDEGAHFDQVLTLEEAAKADPLKYQLLSPTLRSTTPDLKEAAAEQTLLHVVSTFQDQRLGGGQQVWTVQDASVVNGAVHLSVIHYRYGSYEVEVDTTQPPETPLLYTFINKQGKETVPETQLPEKYGEAKSEMVALSPEQVTAVVAQAHAQKVSESANTALKVGTLSTWAALEAMNHVSAEQRAAEAAALTRQSMEQPLAAVAPQAAPQTLAAHTGFNVTAAKNAVKARFARQAKAMEEAKKREYERHHAAKKAQEETDRKARRAIFLNKTKMSQDQKNLLKGGSLAAAAVGGFTACLGAGSLFLFVT